MSHHPLQTRRQIVDPGQGKISVTRQCGLLSIHRSGLYYKGLKESELNLELMRRMDEHFLQYPFLGIRRMCRWLQDQGYRVNRKRLQRLYRLMGLQTLYPKRVLTQQDPQHYKYPYLLKGLKIDHCNQVWAIDITYIPMKKGFMYLVAIIDLYSRYVVNWSLSNTMDGQWVSRTIQQAITLHGVPEIFNSDQGSQFTCGEYIRVLQDHGIRISMDSQGRAADNIFIERLWRSLKYEQVYLNPAQDGISLYQGLARWFEYYNNDRHHQALNYRKPADLYLQAA